jgi:hypothetical protein
MSDGPFCPVCAVLVIDRKAQRNCNVRLIDRAWALRYT